MRRDLPLWRNQFTDEVLRTKINVATIFWQLSDKVQKIP
jgi:hypothetical protein